MQQQNNYCVYIHINKYNGKVYVGQTKTKPEHRWGRNGINYENCPIFWRAIQKYGWDGFVHCVIFDNLTQQKSNEYEKYLIEFFNSKNHKYGYNIRDGGNNGSLSEETKEKLRMINIGKHVPQEIKDKISKSTTGELNHFYGKHHDEKSKEKMRDAKQNYFGKNNPMYGKHHTNDTKELIRQKKLGTHKSPTSILKVSKCVKCVETKEIYISARDAERKTGVSNCGITSCCNGKQKKCRRFSLVSPK